MGRSQQLQITAPLFPHTSAHLLFVDLVHASCFSTRDYQGRSELDKTDKAATLPIFTV